MYYLPALKSASNLIFQTRPSYSNSVISSPKPFAEGIISTEENSEFELAFSVDGRTAYFSRRAPGEKQTIYSSVFIDGEWTAPQRTRFSTDRVEAAMITPDGKYFFFGSERPIPGKPNKGNFDMNVWMMQKTETGWSKAKPIGNKINTKNEESSPRFSRDGKYFFFSRAENFGNYEYGEWSIYFVETDYLDLENLFE